MISMENIDGFINADNDFMEMIEIRDNEMDEITKKLWSMEIDEWQNHSKTYDISRYMEKLNVVPVISDEKILEKCPKFGIDTPIELKAVLTLVMGGTDACYYEQKCKCEYSACYNEYYFDLRYFTDACCDIKISGLSPNDCQAVKLNCYQSENIADAVWNETEQVFEFPDFTFTNPLFRTGFGIYFGIYIQGLKKENMDDVICRYKCMALDYPSRRLLFRSSNGIRVPSRSAWFFGGLRMGGVISVPYDKVRMIRPEVEDWCEDKENDNEIADDVIEVWI